MTVVDDFVDFEVIDASRGMKYERWGTIYLLRPDPQVIWDYGDLEEKYRGEIDAIYYRSRKGGGSWNILRSLPDVWTISYHDLQFRIKLMGFKHTGLFPEQASNWNYMFSKIKNANRKIRVLNLFAYTGGASVVCLKAGASVVHVDSSKGMVDWCRENVKCNHLQDNPIRYLVDDVLKFVKREIRRENQYDAIIMDPPSYGRGRHGEVWNFEDNLDELVRLCVKLLSDDPLFVQINSYTTGVSAVVLENVLKLSMKKYHGAISSGEVGLPISKSHLLLPCGIYGRWDSYE